MACGCTEFLRRARSLPPWRCYVCLAGQRHVVFELEGLEYRRQALGLCSLAVDRRLGAWPWVAWWARAA